MQLKGEKRLGASESSIRGTDRFHLWNSSVPFMEFAEGYLNVDAGFGEHWLKVR